MTDNDRGLVVALVTVNGVKPTEAKVVHIRNTLELGDLDLKLSCPRRKPTQDRILSEPVPFRFDEEDNPLPTSWPETRKR